MEVSRTPETEKGTQRGFIQGSTNTNTQDFRMTPVNMAPPSQLISKVVSQMIQLKSQMESIQHVLMEFGVTL